MIYNRAHTRSQRKPLPSSRSPPPALQKHIVAVSSRYPPPQPLLAALDPTQPNPTQPNSTPSLPSPLVLTNACPRWSGVSRRSWRPGCCATRAGACSTTTTATASAAAAAPASPGVAVVAATERPPHSPLAAMGFLRRPIREDLPCPRDRWVAAVGREAAGVGPGAGGANLETVCRELARVSGGRRRGAKIWRRSVEVCRE